MVASVLEPGGSAAQEGLSRLVRVGEGKSASNAVTVANADEWKIIVRVDVGKIRLENIKGSDLYRVRVPGLGLLGEGGLPDLPGYSRLIAIPPGAEVVATYWTEPAQVVPDVTVAALDTASIDQAAAPIAAEKSAGLPVVEVGKPFVWRGINVVSIWVRPVEYDPGSHALHVITPVEVTLDLIGSSFAALEIPFSPAQDTAFRGAVANWEQLIDQGNAYPAYKDDPAPDLPGPLDNPLDGQDCGDYLIIAADNLAESPAMTDLVNDLTYNRGHTVMLWTASEVFPPPDPCDQDRDVLRNKIRECSDFPDYMLLVGDPDAPCGPGQIFKLITADPSGWLPTDNYFCQVATAEYERSLPDITCGRVPAGSVQEFSDFVAKTIAYAAGPVPAERRATLVAAAGDLSVNDIRAAETWQRLTNHGFMTDRLFESLGTCTPGRVKEAVNDGRVLVDYTGHGNPCEWWNAHFECSDVDGLTNAQLPMVFTTSCWTGLFVGSECMADSWLEAPAAGGVGYLGATALSQSPFSSYAQQFRYDAILVKEMREYGSIIDEMERDAFMFLGQSDHAKSQIENYHAFGDPSLPINDAAQDLQALYKFEDVQDLSPDDDSGWHHDLAISGGSPLYCQGPNGGCLEFVGAESWYARNDALPQTATELTVVAWAWPSSGSSGCLVSRGSEGIDVAWYLQVDGEGPETGLKLGVRTEDQVLHEFFLPSAVPLDRWSSIALVFDSAGSPYQVKAFVDGELVLEELVAGDLWGPQGALAIGALDGGTERFTGNVDEIRVYARSLGADEIAEIAEAGRHDLVAHYPMVLDIDFIAQGEDVHAFLDRSGNTHHQIVSQGSDEGEPFPGVERDGVYFSGGQVLSAVDTPAMGLLDQLTIASWVYFDEIIEGSVLRKPGAQWDEYGMEVCADWMSAKVEDCTATVALPGLKGWHHVAATYDADRGTILAWLDGAMAGEQPCSTLIEDTGSPLILAQNLVGAVDEVRLYRRALPRREIGRLAERGAMLAFWDMDGTGADRSGYGNHGQLQYVEVIEDGQVDQALGFNGVDSLFVVPHDEIQNLGEEDLTLAAWIRANSACHGQILAKGDTDWTYGMYLDEGDLVCRVDWYNAHVPFSDFCTDPPQWHHVACTYSQVEGLQRVYVDGQFAGLFWRKQEIAHTEEPLYVGCRGEQDGHGLEVFDGDIDELYIYGQALSGTEVENLFSQGFGSMLARWEFDGSSWDSTPYGLDLFYLGDNDPPQFGPGRFGTATWSNGDDPLTHASLEFWELLETTDKGFALSFWTSPQSGMFQSSTSPYWVKNQTALELKGALPIYGDGVHDTPGGLRTVLLPGSELSDSFLIPFSEFSGWSHAVLSYDRLAERVSFYLNGALHCSTGYSEPVADWFGNFFVAGFGFYGFQGAMDRVVLFGRPVSPVEARTLFEDENIEGRWTFDYGPDDRGPFAFKGSFIEDADIQAVHRWKGRALALDGDGDYVQVLDGVAEVPEQLDKLQGAMTLSMWMRPESGCDGYAVSKGTWEASPFSVQYVDRAPPLTDYLEATVVTTTGVFVSEVDQDLTGQWHNVQLVFDSHSQEQKVRVYLDEALVDWGDPGGDPDSPLVANDFPLTFGRSQDYPPGWFKGQLDEIRLFNAALPPEALPTLREDVVVDLPFTQDMFDRSAFHHTILVVGGAEIVDGAVVLNGDGGNDDRLLMVNNSVFSDIEDTLSIDVYLYVYAGSMPATIGIRHAEPFLLGVYQNQLCLEAGRGSCCLAYGAYLDTWTHVVARYDRFRPEIGQPAFALFADNGTAWSQTSCGGTNRHARYTGMGASIGSVFSKWTHRVKLHDLQVRRTWE